MQIPVMFRFNLNWKMIFWIIVFGTAISLVAISVIVQNQVNKIEMRLDNIRNHETN